MVSLQWLIGLRESGTGLLTFLQKNCLARLNSQSQARQSKLIYSYTLATKTEI